jgi:integrase
VKYLKRTTSGHVYFNNRGKLTALPAEGSPEFRQAYATCLAARLGETKPAPRLGDGPDTVAKAIEVYLSSTRFAGLAASTRKRLGRHCEAIRTSPLGQARLRDMDVHLIDRWSEGIAKRQGASVADRYVHVLSSIWQCAIKFPQFGIAKLAKPTDVAESHYTVQREHRPWPEAVFENFIATAPANLALAVMLLRWTVQRGGDCIRMTWDDYDGERIAVRPEKTHGERNAEPNYITVVEPLREALDAAPRTAETILVAGGNQHSIGEKPFGSANTLGKAIRRHLRAIGVNGYSMHGLRKMGAIGVVMAGGGVSELKSWGWKSDSQALYYVRGCDSRRLNRNSADAISAEYRRQIEQARHDREVAARRANIKAVA